MSDLIDRQAVLDLIADYDLSMGQVVRGIHALPSVTPKQTMGFDGMTNGEVIKTLFPNGKIIERDEATGYEQMLDDKCSYCSWFDGSWWNAPYKAESEDKDADSN